ncbi:hypothetical protein TNCV_3130801 [Trichonephila clavipes]|nr:hypothetical protein TNCV_3130801 [Trichonephila clavipes]
MALMDHAATSRALSQELGSFARLQEVSARTVRRLFAAAWTRISETMAPTTLDAASDGVIKDEPGGMNGIKIVFSVFGVIVVNAYW